MNRTVSADRPTFRDIIDPNNNLHRQKLIKKIQKLLGGKLVVYTANPNSPVVQATAILLQDAMFFEDLLRTCGDAETGYLMITSPGGDPNAAEKLLIMCRERFPKGFSVIVPDYAKSAATQICLGSDKIQMGYLAELGPIDPQIQIDPSGNTLPARSFIDGLNGIRDRIQKGDQPLTYLLMLAQIPPQLIAICESAIEDSRKTAEKWLKKYMLKDNPKQAEIVADKLSNGLDYKSHGKVIDYVEAKDVLKLNAEKIDFKSELWDLIWELYVRSKAFFQLPAGRNVVKLFESESVSLSVQVAIQMVGIPQPPQPQPQPPKTAPQTPPVSSPQSPEAPQEMEQSIPAS